VVERLCSDLAVLLRSVGKRSVGTTLAILESFLEAFLLLYLCANTADSSHGLNHPSDIIMSLMSVPILSATSDYMNTLDIDSRTLFAVASGPFYDERQT